MQFSQILKDKLSWEQKQKLRSVISSIKSLGKSNDLTALAKIYGTDKWGLHFYTQHYQLHFKPFRNKKITLLEIGVGGHESPVEGARSLRMWKKYFPYGKINSIDIFDKSKLQEKRIKIFKGSQVDEIFLNDLIKIIGNPDIIVDDGSHVNRHVIETFKILFPLLKDGGIYVVEDTQTSYWPSFGGDDKDLNKSSTLLNFFKSLTDNLNHSEYLPADAVPSYFDRKIISMHFYHNMVFIYKGNNAEASNRGSDHKVHN
jgi:demethylmacrocin O-methyltransferase